MSLLRTIAIRAPRAPLAATNRVRFSSTPYTRKDSGSAVKDGIDSVNKTVGDAAVKGIEKSRALYPFLLSYPMSSLPLPLHFSSSAPPPLPFFSLHPERNKPLTPYHRSPTTEQATETLKSTVGLNAKQAEGSAKEMSGEAKGKAEELAGEAKGKTGEAKGKAEDLAGEAKGKTSEVAGKAKGKAEEVKGKM